MPINFRPYANIQAYPYPGFTKSARVRARQNLNMLKITFWTKESTNQVILSISKFPVRTCPRVRCARAQRAEKVKIQNLYMIWISDTIIDNFH